jgi:hypothetical protein
MKFNKTSSRRDVLRTAVVSALLSAAPFSALEAATQNGAPAYITLTDGSRLMIKKVGDQQFMATREQDGKVVDERPTGSFKGLNGLEVVLDQGKVMDVKSTGKREATDWFGAFWK